jgi:hypothetical protein
MGHNAKVQRELNAERVVNQAKREMKEFKEDSRLINPLVACQRR